MDSLEILKDNLKAIHPDLSVRMYVDKHNLILKEIIVPKLDRNRGLGSKAMEMICEYCDQNSLQLALTPDLGLGATSKARLERFYRRFGLIKNSGRKRDFSMNETMRRVPVRPVLSELDTTPKLDSTVTKNTRIDL